MNSESKNPIEEILKMQKMTPDQMREKARDLIGTLESIVSKLLGMALLEEADETLLAEDKNTRLKSRQNLLQIARGYLRELGWLISFAKERFGQTEDAGQREGIYIPDSLGEGSSGKKEGGVVPREVDDIPF